MDWRKVRLFILTGLALGILAGLGEVAHLAWFVRDVSFPPVLFLDAALLDGGLGLLAGLLVGFAWGFRIRRRRKPASPPVRLEAAPRRMSRRSFLRTAGTSVAVAGALGAGAIAWQVAGRRSGGTTSPLWAGSNAVTDGQGRPPNVLLITIDTLRADQLGAYGHPYVHTPALDAFAAQGARFDWHMVQQPQTNPSHASMFTGMYPASSGIRVHMVDEIPDSLQTLAKIFSGAGYATAGLFSWMSFDNQYCNFQPGFHVYQDLTRADSGFLETPVIRDALAQYRVAEQYLAVPQAVNQATGLKQQAEATNKGHADVTTAAAIGQLTAMAGQPFFMWLHYFDPHYPYQPPSSYLDLYDSGYQGPVDDSMSTIDAIQEGRLSLGDADIRRLITFYQSEITYLDNQIVQLFQALDNLNLSPNTVVAITGDHGESFGEHAQLDEGGDFFHPHTLYNTEQHVPLLLRYPGRIAAGATISAPTQAIDVFPTLIQLTGLPVPDQAQGRSTVGLLDGSDDLASRASFSAMPDYTFTSVTTSGWKLIQNVASGQRSLFDIAADPGEQQDMLAARPDVAGALSAQLASWMKAVNIT